MKAVYVAGPFRGEDHWEVAQNVARARAHAFRIAEMGALAVCPHSMFEQFDGTLTDEYWLAATMELMERCDAVAMCPGWEQSDGSCKEYLRADDLEMPTFRLGDPASEAEMRAWIFDG